MPKETLLHQGDPVPHFTITGIDEAQVRYSGIWQRRHLVLVTLASADSWPAARLAAVRGLESDDAAVVVTTDSIAGVPAPAIVIADRWGEIAFSAQAASDQDLPAASEIAEWLRYVQVRCPECEGEAR